ncbi:hypothetical protein G6F66_015547 [Rhizopus arrhizus]|nr:hypothetical protein G6F66_015547 [Rhizopus arrhizus]
MGCVLLYGCLAAGQTQTGPHGAAPFGWQNVRGSGAGGAPAFDEGAEFAHDAAAEGQHADHEDQADHDGDGFPQAQEPVHAGQVGHHLA